MSLLVAILGCVPHTPPPVYAEHVKAVELSPIEKVPETGTIMSMGPSFELATSIPFTPRWKAKV